MGRRRKRLQGGVGGVDSNYSTIKSVYNSCGDISSSLMSPSSKYFGTQAVSLHSCTYLGASIRSTSLFFGSLHPRQDLSLCQLLSASFNIRPSRIMKNSLLRRLPYGFCYLKTTLYFSIKPAGSARERAHKATLRELSKCLNWHLTG